MTKRAAIYVRVSTDKQTIENQVTVLRQIAERRGWEVVEQYSDAGISGSKGRDGRPGLDQMLKDAQRRRFDVVMAWAIDRLGRSLIDLLGTIQVLEACGVDLYLYQQSIDTTTPAGRTMMQMVGSFAEFERAMLRERTKIGLETARREGRVGGRPPKLSHQQQTEIVRMISKGRKTAADAARLFGVHPATISRLLSRMLVERQSQG